jgi:hypothetical protein
MSPKDKSYLWLFFMTATEAGMVVWFLKVLADEGLSEAAWAAATVVWFGLLSIEAAIETAIREAMS